MSWINQNWKALTVVGGILGVSAYASKYFDVEPVDDFGAETQTFEAPKPRLSKKQQETLDYIKEATMRTGNAYITGETYNMRVIKNLFDKKLIKFHPEDEQYKNNWKRPSRVIEADGVYFVVPTKLGNEYRYKFPYGNYQYSSREEWLKNQEPVFDGTTQTLDEVLDELFGAEGFELIMIDSESKRKVVGEYDTYEDAEIDLEESYPRKDYEMMDFEIVGKSNNPVSRKHKFGAETFGADEDYYEDYIQRIFTFIDEKVGDEYFPSIEDEEEVARFKKGFNDEFDETAKIVDDANDWSWDEILGAENKSSSIDDMKHYMNVRWKQYTPRQKMDMELMDLHFGHSNKNTKRYFKKGYEYGWNLAREKAANGEPLYMVARPKDLINTSIRKNGMLYDTGAWAGFEDSWQTYEGKEPIYREAEDDEEYLRDRYGEPLENMSISRKLESVASSLKDLTSEDMLFTVINNLSTKQANQLINRLYAGIREGSIRRKPFRHNMRMGAETADVDFDEAYMENQDAERIMKLLRIVRRKATGSNARYAKNYAKEAENAYYQYGMKGLKVQVAYVLSNLGGWRGDEAKEVKAELRKLTK